MSDPPARRGRLLVVDDESTQRTMLQRILDRSGFEVVVAADGREALERLEDGAFDLLLTDQRMPRMDGIELVRRIKQDATLRHLPVMIVSYKDREEDRLRGLEAGADAYLTKSSFHDEAWIASVVDLIGEPSA